MHFLLDKDRIHVILYSAGRDPRPSKSNGSYYPNLKFSSSLFRRHVDALEEKEDRLVLFPPAASSCLFFQAAEVSFRDEGRKEAMIFQNLDKRFDGQV